MTKHRNATQSIPLQKKQFHLALYDRKTHKVKS